MDMTKSNMDEQKVVTIELYKALSIFASAIIVSAVGGAFIAYRTINSDHFALIAATSRVLALETKATTDELLIPQFVVSQDNIKTIKDDIAQLRALEQNNNDKLNQIIGKLNK